MTDKSYLFTFMVILIPSGAQSEIKETGEGKTRYKCLIVKMTTTKYRPWYLQKFGGNHTSQPLVKLLYTVPCNLN